MNTFSILKANEANIIYILKIRKLKLREARDFPQILNPISCRSMRTGVKSGDGPQL